MNEAVQAFMKTTGLVEETPPPTEGMDGMDSEAAKKMAEEYLNKMGKEAPVDTDQKTKNVETTSSEPQIEEID